MNTQKDPNNEVDLSKFFEKESVAEVRPATIQPMETMLSRGKRRGGLVWVVVVNFILGTAVFSYYIIKANAAGSVNPVTMQKITAPVNYTVKDGETYMPPLP